MITRYLPTILVLFGLFAFACAQIEEPCTDDGCPEFNEELTVPEPIEDIRGSLEYEKFIVPVVTTNSKDEFVYSLNSCITHLYQDVPIEKQIPRELIIAQAALETGWGKSRFANEANNLFGIRTWNKEEEYLLPIPWTKWPGWGVKVFKTKCDSVAYYIKILNEVFAYEEFRQVRAAILDSGRHPTGLDLAPTLTKYASKENYTEIVALLIKKNIRGVYEL
tara:strand:+ start:290 stop:952 length:663 start_codon:yes stop_codon:yes gene_type:complete